MSIKTPGLIEADNFQGTAVTPAGFVKNDASGNFLLGEIGSGWTLLETFTVGALTSAFTFAAVLNGDVDYQYRIIYSASVNTLGAGDRILLRPNAISTGQNTLSRRVGSDGSVTFNTSNLVLAQAVSTVSEVHHLYGDFDFTAHSGQQRILIGKNVESRVSVGRTNLHFHYGKWDDLTTNITSLKVEAEGLANIIPAGSEWSLYKVKRV